ncbi:MAG: hypothetical protein COB37_11965 [Kordiimonadales bacterium]|nr:MAG: hypothetical protein COB37_11965 [Kordiimonadales bacterium]
MKKTIISVVLLCLAGCGSSEPSAPKEADEATRRTVAQGDLIGFVAENGAHVWRGVPYGADAGGKNRWRAPRPAPAWDSVKLATKFGPVCPQIATAFVQIEGFETGRLEGSEDCLSIDIYAPADAVGRDLPVMVWIHGGSNISGASQLYIGDQLSVNEDVIIISVQYRLGPLGWFSHDALKASALNAEDKAANFGLLDLVASLRWVRENVTAFGGDANRVTIFGESAGGHNVAALLASPLAKGLFHGAIIQSGSFSSVSVADAQGLSGDQPNPSNDVAERLGGPEKFHTATTQEVFDAYQLNNGYLRLPRVIEDGVSLPIYPMRDAFASTDTFNVVPIITGTNRDENKLFFMFNERLAENYLGIFYVAHDQDLYDAASDYTSRVWRLRAVDEPAALMNKAGHQAVYAYRFDWDEGGSFLWTDLSKMLGAAHGMEIPFVFNRFQLIGEGDAVLFESETLATRLQLSAAMGAYWAEFARSGTPEAKDGTVWPRYGNDANLMRFDSASDGGIQIVEDRETLSKLISDLKNDHRLDESVRCELAHSFEGLAVQQKTHLVRSVGCQAERQESAD